MTEAYSDGEAVLHRLDLSHLEHEAAGAQAYQALSANQRRELRYMRRLGYKHLLTWPSKKTFPRFRL